MIQYGDITKLSGYELEPVDLIVGGSPCQDLSVAGKRAGLDGERSGLFMEMIRIIREMREKTNGIYPRFALWENVPGAFSSNEGRDFSVVLGEFSRLIESTAPDVPVPQEGWTKSGVLLVSNGSIAWRTHDAQYWGVPQRRRRIALIADLRGQSAPEILFECKGMSGDITESGKEGEGAASDAGAGIEKTSRAISFQERAGCHGGGKGILIQNERTGALSTLNNQSVCAFEPGAASRVGGHVYEDDVAGTVRANAGDNQQAVVYGISSYDSNAMKSANPNSGIYKAETSRTLDLNGGSPACNQGGMAVVCLEGNGSRPSHKGNGFVESDTMYTLNSTEHHAVCIENHPADSRVKISEDGVVQTLSSRMGTGGGNVPMVMEPKEPISIGNGQLHDAMSPSIGVSKTLNCMDDPAKVMVYGLDRASFNQGKNAQYDFQIDEEKIGTLVAKGPGAVLPWTNSVVRRLTPLECERLQGYPDGWTDIPGASDSARYKAIGNSIALPFWEFLAHRFVEMGEVKTIGSLFDGIGGFPLVFQRAGAETKWTSEIEPFCEKVVKYHMDRGNL